MLLTPRNILLFAFAIWSPQLYTNAHALPRQYHLHSKTSPLRPLNTSIQALTGANCNGSFRCFISGHFIQNASHLGTKSYPPDLLPDWTNTGPMNDTAFYAEGSMLSVSPRRLRRRRRVVRSCATAYETGPAAGCDGGDDQMEFEETGGGGV
ncbi:MAG: hypothetical protein Q9226_005958 [Calogaya cf. arnoldii]